MKHKIGIVIGILLCVVILPFAAVGGTLAAKSYIHKDKVPAVLGVSPLVVATGSMRPEFKENDLILMRSADVAALEKGDIIAYYDRKGVVVSHRIIAYDVDEGGARLYITKGDANNVQDQNPVPAGKVIGRLMYVIPGGGKIMRVIANPVVTVLAVAVPLALFYGGVALQRKLAQKKEKEAVAEANDGSPGDP